MLNPEICYRCIKKENMNNMPVIRARFFCNLGRHKYVYCPASLAGKSRMSWLHRNPKSYCPYKFEHAVSEGSTNA
jgi:hypothetical protein